MNNEKAILPKGEMALVEMKLVMLSIHRGPRSDLRSAH